MKKHKSIKEVLTKGQLWVNLPAVIIMFGTPLVVFFITSLFFSKNYSLFLAFVGLLFGGVLGGVWWSFLITKWRIWAFKSTQKKDWKELKRKAIEELLIWHDGAFFERTEIRSKKQQKIIKSIDAEIENLPAIFEDDLSIPKATYYFYDRGEIIHNLLTNIILIGVGIFVILKNDILIGIALIGMGIYFFKFKNLKNINNKDVQLSISEIGIDMKFEKFGLIEWGNIEKIAINQKNGYLQLDFRYATKPYNIEFPLNSFKIKDYGDFLKRMDIYLNRNRIQKEKYN